MDQGPRYFERMSWVSHGLAVKYKYAALKNAHFIQGKDKTKVFCLRYLIVKVFHIEHQGLTKIERPCAKFPVVYFRL